MALGQPLVGHEPRWYWVVEPVFDHARYSAPLNTAMAYVVRGPFRSYEVVSGTDALCGPCVRLGNKEL
jgi:hypothetical protein